jgi:hypothetical protein
MTYANKSSLSLLLLRVSNFAISTAVSAIFVVVAIQLLLDVAAANRPSAPSHAQANDEEVGVYVESFVYGRVEPILHLDTPHQCTGHPACETERKQMPYGSRTAMIFANPVEWWLLIRVMLQGRWLSAVALNTHRKTATTATVDKTACTKRSM